jgi:F0F1-type ATP synthase epsilon subunit
MKLSKDVRLTVDARAPFHVYFQGQAQMVSGLNKVGRFDILPGHADFFSVMIPGEITIETDGEQVVFSITNGIVTVRDDQVLLFVNI